MYSSGFTALPRLFDILAPSRTIMPCARNFTYGSSNARRPASCSTIVTKREYNKCNTACSLPPMYDVTGSHFSVSAGSNGASEKSVLGYRRKYQALSRKVSDTSVSRRATPPHDGQLTRYHDSTRARGEIP